MAAEVLHMDGSPLEDGAKAGDSDVIDGLRELLQQAMNGEVTAIALVAKDGASLRTVTRGKWFGGYFEAIGALECLKHDMMSQSSSDD